MESWLDPIRRTLDSAERTLDCFFRDDDVGWDDSRLWPVLESFDRFGVPLDLAVIPEALSEHLARELRSHVARCNQIRIHQHGFSHTNHEFVGRKCEFGISRSRSQQFEDIWKGRMQMQEMLGAAVDPFFTPPWNRCTETTVRCLVELGYSMLSRDATAEPFGIPSLTELPINVDWFGKHKGARLIRQQFGEKVARTIEAYDRVGVMLHHQLMNADERTRLDELLALLAGHEQVRCLHMHEVMVLAPIVEETGSAGFPGRQ
jgi:peptidoglycan/xylan/chitin deacetylase (PgdA/CDA1 family)